VDSEVEEDSDEEEVVSEDRRGGFRGRIIMRGRGFGPRRPNIESRQPLRGRGRPSRARGNPARGKK